MKKITTIAFVIINLICFGQNPKLEVEGNWICLKIVDSNNDLTSGKFGSSNEYLRFLIKGNTLTTYDSPFHLGFAFPIKIESNDSTISLSVSIDIPFDENTYKIIYSSKDSLVLKTKNMYSKELYYTFINQQYYLKSNDNPINIECGTIVVKHILHSWGTISHMSDNEIILNQSLYNQCPVFASKSYDSFAQYLTEKFNFPKEHQKDPPFVSNLVVEFEFNSNGLRNLKVYAENTSDSKIADEIYKLVDKKKKCWYPTIYMDSENINFKIKIHLKLIFVKEAKRS